MESISHWLALKSVPGIGNRLFLQLVKEFGTPEKVFTASAGELLKVEGVNNHLSSVIHNYKVPAQVEEDLNLVKKSGFKIITFSDPDYPSLLRHIHDPPLSFTYMANSARTALISTLWARVMLHPMDAR